MEDLKQNVLSDHLRSESVTFATDPTQVAGADGHFTSRAQHATLAACALTGSISSASTSTATLRIIASSERTTRRSFFLRTNTPSTPAITPALIRTLSPDSQVWVGLDLAHLQAEANRFDVRIGQGPRFSRRTHDRQHPRQYPARRPALSRAMRTKT